MNSEQNVKGLLSVWKLDGRDAFIMRTLATLWSIKALFFFSFFQEKDRREGQGMTKHGNTRSEKLSSINMIEYYKVNDLEENAWSCS